MYNFKVMVIGDYGLDIWREGESHRLSPEAPVPVVLNPSDRKSPGLAGNVAANLRSLGAEVLCFGVVGESRFGEATLEACIRAGLPGCSATLIRDRSRFATVKERIISDAHQITRIDRESTHDISMEIVSAMVNQIEASMKFSDGVVISDYGKGVCTPSLVSRVMQIAKREDVPVFVDPKKNLLIYKGATILKPNAEEWQAYVDAYATTDVEVGYVVITRGAEGMRIQQRLLYEWIPQNIPGYKVPVYDRTGAGDTAMAVMALEYLHSKDIVKAVKLANMAGALAVQHSGTYVITRGDMVGFVSQHGIDFGDEEAE
jgi:D-beta-D-heptose 7-phosphate kinase/D-beta-D-heptose 1-phosphate adenosyltransferase